MLGLEHNHPHVVHEPGATLDGFLDLDLQDVGGLPVAAVAYGLAAAEGPVLLEPECAAGVDVEVCAGLAGAEGGGLGQLLEERPDSLLVELVDDGSVRGVLVLIELAT